MSEITGRQYRAYLSAHVEGQVGLQSKNIFLSISNPEDPLIPTLVTLGLLDGRTNTVPRSKGKLAELLDGRDA